MKARKIYWAFLLVFLIAAIWLQTTGALGEAFWGLYGIIIAGFLWVVYLSTDGICRIWKKKSKR